ncbi:type VI secretion protein [Dyella dinghuensis]|uniref:Type VI secretion protein n=1 Tax=Dyella dinghuensis TaxID=1920169 RepID=A0A432LYQ3_9GAMM|nr:type IV secretion system protein [Dyella dinghuensis]RUL66562.1 type VI secretion protein [Dyella dinghuensis]
MNNLGDYVFYALVYNYLQTAIDRFQNDVLGNAMTLVSAVALVLVTLWIMIQGYRIITGQSREPMMTLVVNAARVAVIVAAASTMSMFSQPLQSMLSANGDGSLGAAISALVSGNTSPVAQIDRNMAATQLTLSAIDVVQVPPGDTENAQAKAHAMMLAGFGTASPPMAAGAMLLLYQFAMALFIGLGPIFILCLIFEQTKELFRKWLFYGIGTLFSIATLCAVSSIVLKLTENVAVALWGADLINNFTGQGAEGLSSRALEQGGIGLLLTVLIVSVPPMAAMFFQGTMGSFMHFSAFSGGPASQPGPQGQPPGSYGALQSNTSYVNSGGKSGTGGFDNTQAATPYLGSPTTIHSDTIKASSTRPVPTTGDRS